MQLGKLGLWAPMDVLTAAEGAEFARRVEAWGYAALWLPESRGRDVLVHSSWLLANTNVRASIEGHCDERGTREYNQALGERRANAVRDFLVSQGVPTSRLVTTSWGKERPVATGSNEEAWAQNRNATTSVR